MRNVYFKPKDALALFEAPLELAEFQKLIGRKKSADGGYHMKYEPNDLRELREKLLQRLQGDRKVRRKAVMPPVICVRMPKGGVGKTSILGNLATGLALGGRRIFCIDADSQASKTMMMGVNAEQEGLRTLDHVLFHDVPLQDAIIPIYNNAKLDLLPADNALAQIEFRLVAATSREKRLKRMLVENKKFLSQNYDLILIDTPPSTSMLNFNVLVASDLVIAVLNLADGLSLKAMQTLYADIDEVRSVTNKPVPLLMVMNGYKATERHTAENLQLLRTHYGKTNLLWDHPISRYVGFGRQARHEGSRFLVEEEPTSVASGQLLALSRYLVQRFSLPLVAPSSSVLEPAVESEALTETGADHGE